MGLQTTYIADLMPKIVTYGRTVMDDANQCLRCDWTNSGIELEFEGDYLSAENIAGSYTLSGTMSAWGSFSVTEENSSFQWAVTVTALGETSIHIRISYKGESVEADAGYDPESGVTDIFEVDLPCTAAFTYENKTVHMRVTGGFEHEQGGVSVSASGAKH